MKLSKQATSADSTAVADVCVARQPIFGTAGDVAGYELLYRRTATDTAVSGGRRSVMAADVVVHSFLHIGLDRLTAGRRAYVNFTREMLLSGAHTLLPPEHVVIELLEDVEPDEQVEAACEQLVNAGYALALDDYSGGTHFRRLLELATIVKVDVLTQPLSRLDEIAQDLAVYDVRLLAERVETGAMRAMCAGLGYELFQGYYFARPEVVRDRTLVSDELAIIQAMAVLRDARSSDADAEAAFGTDVGLSYRLLRMVNSAARGGRGIESIRHAIQLGGREELGKWLALLLVSSMAARGSASRELLHLAVQRARLCELLAIPVTRGRDANACFLVGLFSLLDAISGLPMVDLLDAVGLAPAVRSALMERTGPYAMPLSIAEAYERGDWSSVMREASSAGLDASVVGALYVQSLAWTRDRLLSLTAG
ncbi:MAG TPA: EAL domain-containing protein [Gemmatimonadaceae bacterium]|nr:EAL domain-containing protein [Gemmatimonadaceae bacterium]